MSLTRFRCANSLEGLKKNHFCVALKKYMNNKMLMIGVGFEPTPPKRLVPKTSALDRSAIQPKVLGQRIYYIEGAKRKIRTK